MSQSTFAACHVLIDPQAYITACTDTLCNYPAVDGLQCQFLESYAEACSLLNVTLGDWRSTTKCRKILAVKKSGYGWIYAMFYIQTELHCWGPSVANKQIEWSLKHGLHNQSALQGGGTNEEDLKLSFIRLEDTWDVTG